MNTKVVGQLDLSTWTPIAVRNRWSSKAAAAWRDLPEAPMTLRQVKEQHAAGRLLKALRYEEDDVFVVVKRACPALPLAA